MTTRTKGTDNVDRNAWNLSALFDKQAELDDRILSDRGLKHEDVADRLITATLVEIHEMLNEWKGFKFWKQNVKIDRDKLLEETVDVLHFLLSIGNLLQVPTTHPYVDKQKDPIKTSRTLTATVLMMDGPIMWTCGFAYFRGLAEQFGFSQTELEAAYHAKNAENHARQDRGY